MLVHCHALSPNVPSPPGASPMTTTDEATPLAIDAPGTPIRIDLGCGTTKKPGFLGVDHLDAPEVDHVLDLLHDPLPFDDDTVDEVFSSHFFEHIDEPNHVLSEIGRVCRDGARIEIWTPYAFTADAFVYGHKTFFTELPWMHFCVHQRDTFADLLVGRWQLHRVIYVVHPSVQAEIEASGTSVGFAIKYWKGVVTELGVEMTFHHDPDTPVVHPAVGWRSERHAPELHPLVSPTPVVPVEEPTAPTPIEAAGRRLVPARFRAPLRQRAAQLGLVVRG
jgi:predicted SAM-dependent methyltransferase